MNISPLRGVILETFYAEYFYQKKTHEEANSHKLIVKFWNERNGRRICGIHLNLRWTVAYLSGCEVRLCSRAISSAGITINWIHVNVVQYEDFLRTQNTKPIYSSIHRDYHCNVPCVCLISDNNRDFIILRDDWILWRILYYYKIYNCMRCSAFR